MGERAPDEAPRPGARRLVVAGDDLTGHDGGRIAPGPLQQALAPGREVVGHGRALAAQPNLLLLDEPSAGLTREEREDLAHFVLKTKEELGILIIWIEHDMQMVADLADRILVLDVGRAIADGPPQHVLDNPAVIRAYLGAGTGDQTGAEE